MRLFASLLFLIFFMVLWTLLFPGQATAKFRVATTIQRQPLYFFPPLAAEEKGFWKEEGLDAEFIPFRASREFDQAAVAGQVHLGVTLSSGVITSRSAGVPVTVVADLEGFYSWYLWVRADSPIRGPGDLKEAKIKIGVLRLGGLGHVYPQVMAKGMGIEKNVRYIAAGGILESLAALKSGVVDALVMSAFSLARLEYEGVARKVMAMDDYVSRELDPLIVIAPEPVIAKEADAVQKGVAGIVKGGRYVMSNPSWAVQKMQKELNLPAQVAEKLYGLLSYSKDGRIYPERLERMKDFLLRYGLIRKERAPALSELYTNRFVPVK